MYSSIKTSSAWLSFRGFSIVEVIIVVTILTALLGVGLVSISNYQVQSRDSERASDVEIIAQSLERQYKTQAVAIGPTYPPSSTSAATVASYVNDSDATKAPGQTSNSIVVATTAGDQTPTISQYIYQPLNIDDTLCSTAPCVRYKLFYRLEVTNVVVSKDSMRQQ